MTRNGTGHARMRVSRQVTVSRAGGRQGFEPVTGPAGWAFTTDASRTGMPTALVTITVERAQV